MIFGDGFLPFHFELAVDNGVVEEVRDAVEAALAPSGGQWIGIHSVEQLVNRFEGITGVRRVVVEGAQSSVLIPLRMVRARLDDGRAVMSTVLGTGPIAEAIEAAVRSYGIDLVPSRRLEDADSPIECSIRDSDGAHRSLRLYPCSRRRFAAGVSMAARDLEHLVINRANKGLAKLASSACVRGGEVSFRPHRIGQHNRAEEVLEVLPATTQLVLSTRDGVLQKVAGALGVGRSSCWRRGPEGWVEGAGATLAEALLGHMRTGGLVLLHCHRDNGSVFFDGRSAPVYLEAPSWADGASRASRLQGALLGLRLAGRVRGSRSSYPSVGLPEIAAAVQEAAFAGTRSRPWTFGTKSAP